MEHIIIPGGSGFLGMSLAEHFENQGYRVIILSRRPKPSQGQIEFQAWDGKTIGAWAASFEGAEAIINLTGRSVDCRYTQKNKDLILNSRLDSTHVVAEAIRQCKVVPKVWINAGSATIYKHSLEKGNDEKRGILGDGFSVGVCRAWEKAFHDEDCPSTRKLFLRISIVLGKDGGAFPPIRQLVRFGLGGKQGSGRQMISWIHIRDFIRAVEWLMKGKDKVGIYNIVSPHPERNATFMGKLRNTMGMPFGMPLPKFLLEIGAIMIQTQTELILKSRYVLAQKLQDEGFEFNYPTIDDAFEQLLEKGRNA